MDIPPPPLKQHGRRKGEGGRTGGGGPTFGGTIYTFSM